MNRTINGSNVTRMFEGRSDVFYSEQSATTAICNAERPSRPTSKLIQILQALVSLFLLQTCCAAEVEKEILLKIPASPYTLNSNLVSISIDVSGIRQQIELIANKNGGTIFVELENVEAEAAPKNIWDVYVGLPKAGVLDKSHYVGSLKLSDTGIKGRKSLYQPAYFAFAFNHVLETWLKENKKDLQVTFISRAPKEPVGSPNVESPSISLKIGHASIIVERLKK